MNSFGVHGLMFYFLCSFLASKKCFIISLILLDDVDIAKFTTRNTIADEPENPKKMSFKGPVLSIEDLPDANSNKANFKIWFVLFDTIEPFLAMSRELFQVEVLKMEKEGDKNHNEDED